VCANTGFNLHRLTLAVARHMNSVMTPCGQGLTLVPVSAQLELTLPLSANLKLTLTPIYIPQIDPWMCPEGAQVEL